MVNLRRNALSTPYFFRLRTSKYSVGDIADQLILIEGADELHRQIQERHRRIADFSAMVKVTQFKHGLFKPAS